MSPVVVFLGPTLTPAEAALHTSAVVLPPARAGDVYDAVTRLEARAIGLIDGLFGGAPSVWHKEILFALSRGVRVLGAASMGALRAAELASFGMEGIGPIYRAFASGELTRDDEVAVAHADEDAGYRPLSEALVNLRQGLQMAAESGVITAASRERLLGWARATFYADRSWPALFRAGAQAGVAEDELAGLRALVARVRPNRKRDDAIALLQALSSPAGPPRPRAAFEATSFWEAMSAAWSRGGGEAASEVTLARHALLASGGEERRRGALLLALAEAEAERAGLEPAPADLAAAAERLRRVHGLEGREGVMAWLEGQEMTIADLHALVRVEALVELVARARGAEARGCVAAELQRRGEFGRVSRELAALPAALTWSDAGLSREELLAWYQREVGWLGRDPARAAEALGCATVDELLGAIARVHAVRAR